MTTGQRIKEARKKAGLTQKELGAKLGVTYQTLAQWENDLRNPKIETKGRIANALGVSIAYLDGWYDAVSSLEEAGMSVSDVAEEIGMPVEKLMEIINSQDPNSLETTEKIIRVACLLLEEAKREGVEKYPDDSAIKIMQEKLSKGAPFRKMSDAGAHKAGFLKFHSDEDRIAYFYGKLNTDGKLSAAKCFYKNLDENKLADVADYVENLAGTPQFQRKDDLPAGK